MKREREKHKQRVWKIFLCACPYRNRASPTVSSVWFQIKKTFSYPADIENSTHVVCKYCEDLKISEMMVSHFRECSSLRSFKVKFFKCGGGGFLMHFFIQCTNNRVVQKISWEVSSCFLTVLLIPANLFCWAAGGLFQPAYLHCETMKALSLIFQCKNTLNLLCVCY